MEQHELAAKEGRAPGLQQDAVPCVRLLSDEHFVKRIAKVSPLRLLASQLIAITQLNSQALPQSLGLLFSQSQILVP